MDDEAQKTLELFIEKTEYLAKCVSENGPYKMIGTFRHSDEEEWDIHSAINVIYPTLRMFIQERDGIALYLLETQGNGKRKKREISDLPNMSATWYECVAKAKKVIADILAYEYPNLVYNNKPITRKDAFETLFYGESVHADSEKREIIAQWKSVPGLLGEIKKAYLDVVWMMLGQIVEVAQASRQELSLNTSKNEQKKI